MVKMRSEHKRGRCALVLSSNPVSNDTIAVKYDCDPVNADSPVEVPAVDRRSVDCWKLLLDYVGSCYQTM